MPAPCSLRRNSRRARSHALMMALCLWMAGACLAWAQESVVDQAWEVRDQDPQAAITLLDERIDTLEAGDDPAAAELAPLLELRASIGRDLGHFEQATADARRFQELAESLDDPAMTARAYFLGGTIEAEQGNVAGALERFHAARELLETLDDPAALARIYNALGVAHNFVPDQERARVYYQRALELAREAGNAGLETTALGNLALVVSDLEGPEAGLVLYDEALQLARERGDHAVVAYQLGNICSRLVEAGRIDDAESTCADALERVRDLGHPRILAGTRMSLGDLRRAQGRLDEARAEYERALELAAGRVSSVEEPVLLRLTELHEDLGEPQVALDYLGRLTEFREQALETERGAMVEEMEVRYQVAEQEREIQVLELERELQAAQLHQRNLMMAGLVLALVLASAVAFVAWRGFRIKSRLQRELARRNRDLERAVRTIARLARQDSLTGLFNRGAFLAAARQKFTHHRETGEPLTLALADIDDFKTLNDRHGHPVGDQVLKELSRRLQESVRKQDVVARWGGEEFVFLLPDTGPEAAAEVIRRLREDLAASPIRTDAGIFPVTMTFGIAPVTDDLDTAIHAADKAMYHGKNAGRDRIVHSDDVPRRA